jgi:hypothetical protein
MENNKIFERMNEMAFLLRTAFAVVVMVVLVPFAAIFGVANTVYKTYRFVRFKEPIMEWGIYCDNFKTAFSDLCYRLKTGKMI